MPIIRKQKPSTVSIANIRANEKSLLKNAPLIQAPLWAAITVYVANVNVVRHSNGQLLQCVVSGTSLASEPVFVFGALMVEAGGPSWAAIGKKSIANADGYQVPIVTFDATIPAGAALVNAFDTTLPGRVWRFGTLVGGTGYVNGTYNNVPLTGGTGTGAVAQSITVAGGVVTAVVIPADGTGNGDYKFNDVLSASASSLGGSGSGFTYTVKYVIQAKSTIYLFDECMDVLCTNGTGVTGHYFNDGSSALNIQAGYYSVEFITDDPKPGLLLGGMSTTYNAMLSVDDYPLEEMPTRPNGTSARYLKVDWSGVKKLRKYRYETRCNLDIRGVAILPNSVIFQPKNNRLRGILYSDSYANTLSTYQYNGNSRILGLEIFARVGIRSVRNYANGGTGYLHGKNVSDNNGTSQTYNCKGVIDNNDSSDFNDVIHVVFAHGLNDLSEVSADVISNAIYCWKKALVRHPNAVFSVFGLWSENSGPGASSLALDSALSAAASTIKSANGFNYHSICADPDGSWTLGTDNWGNIVDGKNAGLYIGSDGTHPSWPGSEFLIVKMSYLMDQDLVEAGY